ncbi:unnamed protein product [Closterium sp. Naga37s-1]|nr:unnamed protein product [Closterium sp. Naga37s-1]
MDLVRRGVLVVVQQPVEDDEAGGTDTSSSRRLPREIFILGTTHVSETAAEDAMRVVRSVQPQNVVVELCKSRSPIMYDPIPEGNQPLAPSSATTGAAAAPTTSDAAATSSSGAAPPARDLFLMGGASLPQTLMRSIQLGGQSSLLLRLLLSFVSRQSAQAAGVQPGHEFRAAREAADAIGAQLVLGDRPIEITLRRAWKALSLLDRARLASALLQGGLKGGSLEQSELRGTFSKQLERRDSTGPEMANVNVDGDVVGRDGGVERGGVDGKGGGVEGEEEVEFLSAVFQEVARQFPTLIGPLVHERDALWNSASHPPPPSPNPPILPSLLVPSTVSSMGLKTEQGSTAAAPAPTAAGAALDTASWKLLESAFGFSFLYPSSYIVTINRKNDPADAPLTADGAQALAVVGNFVTFDMMSVIRYAFNPNPDKLAPLIQRILPNGWSTPMVEDTVFPTPCPHSMPPLHAPTPCPHSMPPLHAPTPLSPSAPTPLFFLPSFLPPTAIQNLSTSLVEDTVFPSHPIIELPLNLQKILSALASPAGLSFE